MKEQDKNKNKTKKSVAKKDTKSSSTKNKIYSNGATKDKKNKSNIKMESKNVLKSIQILNH